MKFFCAIVLLSVAVAVSAGPLDDLWNFYKGNYRKNINPIKDAIRKALFIAIHDKIQKHNSENKGWQMSHNQFSDMSDIEKQALLGAKPTMKRERSMDVAISTIEERAVPASIDLRTDPCMQPVKNQGECGSCWSFATITPLEFNQCKKTGTPVAFSEQMLVDCDTGNGGCNGGMYDGAWSFLKAKGGAMKSSAYPYVSGTTKAAGTTCKYDGTQVGAKVSSYSWSVQSGVANQTLIMSQLAASGPMPSAIKIVPSFYNYAAGVFSDPACKVADPYDVDHAVVIVGYGTTTTAPITNYWIVRNSWSTGWGIGGYFLIQRGNNMCNIEAWTATVTVV